MQTICCICHKTKTENRWVRSTAPQSKQVSHGYCPRCYRQMLEQLNSYCANRLDQPSRA